MTTQAEWAEVTNPAPDPAVMIDPVTATPTAAPNWRLVEASAPAMPAWSVGMPHIAVW
ncbi:hypothetical protein GCM10009646_57800 [Streptomyces aureus]